MVGAAAFVAGGLVSAGVVESEVADELVVDEHRGVVVVEDDAGGLCGVAGAEVDDPVADVDHAGGDDVGGAHDSGVVVGVLERFGG